MPLSRVRTERDLRISPSKESTSARPLIHDPPFLPNQLSVLGFDVFELDQIERKIGEISRQLLDLLPRFCIGDARNRDVHVGIAAKTRAVEKGSSLVDWLWTEPLGNRRDDVLRIPPHCGESPVEATMSSRLAFAKDARGFLRPYRHEAMLRSGEAAVKRPESESAVLILSDPC